MAQNGARALWYAIALCLLGIVFFGFSLLIQFRGQTHIDRVATTTHEALCAFKKDLTRRADDTEVYIFELRNGYRRPIPGISIADLARTLSNQRMTLRSLSDLKCG